MINDDGSTSPEVSHYKYVDDLTLCQTFSDADQTDSMQNELDQFNQWAIENNMKLNPNKCHAMQVSFKQNTTVGYVFQVGTSVLDQVNCIKILGINIQNNLRWDIQVISMCNALNCKIVFFMSTQTVLFTY